MYSFEDLGTRLLRYAPVGALLAMTEMVGATGFEPATLCSQSRCATGLRYAPKKECED
jgi:hypothetical protein